MTVSKNQKKKWTRRRISSRDKKRRSRIKGKWKEEEKRGETQGGSLTFVQTRKGGWEKSRRRRWEDKIKAAGIEDVSFARHLRRRRRNVTTLETLLIEKIRITWLQPKGKHLDLSTSLFWDFSRLTSSARQDEDDDCHSGIHGLDRMTHQRRWSRRTSRHPSRSSTDIYRQTRSRYRQSELVILELLLCKLIMLVSWLLGNFL